MRSWKQIFIFLLIIDSLSLVSAARYAAVVMDAGTGKILEAENAHGHCFPASLTKKMTLYLLFEALESGRLKPTSSLYVSAYAASQAPSKLGLKAGERVPLEAIIMGLVTRSANDAAMVAAEALGNSQAGFARMMNRKARELGMAKTVFRNPTGLPDSHQVTTAHDMAVLGLALYRDFPHHYYRFKTRAFTYKGQVIENHNRLLGKVPGVDGFKTGYTRAAGFNLTASAVRNKRRLIVVVMGGANRHWRDRRVTELFEKHFKKFHPTQKDLYEDAIVSEEKEDNDASQTMDDLIQTITVENHQIKEEPVVIPVAQAPEIVTVSTPATVSRSPWIVPQAIPAPVAKTNKKATLSTTGVQVGTFKTKLQATLVAQRVAKFSRGTATIKPIKTRRSKKTRFLAQVKGLTKAQARTVCKDLKDQHQECQPQLS